MLELRGKIAGMPHQRPSVTRLHRVGSAGRKKRFDRDDLSVFEPARVTTIVITDYPFGLLMQAAPDAVASKILDHRELMCTCRALDGFADQVDWSAGARFGQRVLQSQLRGLAETLFQRRNGRH